MSKIDEYLNKYVRNINNYTSVSKQLLIALEFIIIISFIFMNINNRGNIAYIKYKAANLIKKEQTNSSIIPVRKSTVRHDIKSTYEKQDTIAQYIKVVERHISENWTPPKEKIYTDKRTTVIFSIDKKGNLISVKIQQSSGNKDFDNSVINAIKLTAPFQPFPQNFKIKSIDIKYIFYNEFRNWKNKDFIV